MENKELTRIFSASGKRNGFTDVTASFAAFRDFKIKWTRNYKWAEFEVSDYLWDAPEEVLGSMADTIFAKIHGRRSEYPTAVCDWLTSEEFIGSKQATYIRRYPGLCPADSGRRKDLSASYARLVDAGLVEEVPHSYVGWIRPYSGRSVGHASVLMKVIGMSSALDGEEISDELLDYCLYSQAAHVGMGFNPCGSRRGPQYDELLSRFPERQRMESELRRMGLHI